MDASLKTLSLMAAELGATTTILREREIGCARKVTEVLVRKVSLLPPPGKEVSCLDVVIDDRILIFAFNFRLF